MNIPHLLLCSFLKRKILFLPLLLCCCFVHAQYTFSTDYCKINISNKGYITAIQNNTIKPFHNFIDAGKPSPLLCLYNEANAKYYYPVKASYNVATHKMQLQYENGSVATVSIERVNGKYIRLTLLKLTNREAIDDIQWGPVQTNISNLFGEMLGVARDTSEAINYAIGLLSLNDATTGGLSNTVGGIAPFEYLVHSPDNKRFPLPENLHEGQYYSIGGDGINDVAFYAHPEEYYRILYGNAAGVDTTGHVYIVQHASDRSKPGNIFFSLMPKMEANKPVHQQVQAIPGVDYSGSKVALWGCPDTMALMNVIQNIVQTEGLPYPTLNGAWVKDPTRYVPDVFWGDGNYDSAVSYTKQLGFKAIEAWNLGEYYPNREDEGNIPLTMPFADGKKSVRDFTSVSNANGVSFGLHALLNFLQHNISSDVSPLPNDSLCWLQKRILMSNISSADTAIVVDDPAYLDEIAGWEGHPADANIIKIGDELIWYKGVGKIYPYTLQHVKRGYWGTAAAAHQKGTALYKLQTNCYGGLVPDIFLQDKYAAYYAAVCSKNGIHYMDFDGEEGLFYQGHGEYAVKRFYRNFFNAVKRQGIDFVRVTGATLSGGSWHYHSVWNVGGGTNMFNSKTRSWGIEGKDLRNVTYANYFPSSFGGNFEMDTTSTVQEYENIQALSVGLGVTYIMKLSEKSAESCPQKYAIFNAVKAWENARAAGAFTSQIKKELADTTQYFHLEQSGENTWSLYKVNSDGSGKKLHMNLTGSGN